MFRNVFEPVKVKRSVFNNKNHTAFKGRVICPLHALVCPCLMTNVIVKCKIVSFLLSLYSFLFTMCFFFFFFLKTNGTNLKKGYISPVFTF